MTLASLLSDFQAQGATLKLDSGMQLKLTGSTNHFYQLESKTNLQNGSWYPVGTNFPVRSNPVAWTINGNGKQSEFFRVRSLDSTTNNSYVSPCAEYDSVDYPHFGDPSNYWITATHPTWAVTNYDNIEDFSNCPTGNPDPVYNFSPILFHSNVYDDHATQYMQVNRLAQFWRPQGMTVYVNGVKWYDDIHFVELGRFITGSDGEWPIFLVLYCDGNLRLIPFPPVGHKKVAFGSSVIVGPAPIAYRPVVDIASVDYNTSARTLFVIYRSGGSATLDLNTVTRTNAIVKVAVNYPTDLPFCTLRSMFVDFGNSDCDTLEWKDLSGNIYDVPIMSFVDAPGTDWFYKRSFQSKHNNSAPDIRITPK